MSRGEDAAELEVVLDRLDAIQARLELLERDRDTRLRDAAADLRERRAREQLLTEELRERRARERELEEERVAALEAAMQGRMRYEAAETEIARLRVQIDALLAERESIIDMVDRAAASRAWRIGHRLTSIGRLATFQRSHGTSALARLQAGLSVPPRELTQGSGDISHDADSAT